MPGTKWFPNLDQNDSRRMGYVAKRPITLIITISCVCSLIALKLPFRHNPEVCIMCYYVYDHTKQHLQDNFCYNSFYIPRYSGFSTITAEFWVAQTVTHWIVEGLKGESARGCSKVRNHTIVLGKNVIERRLSENWTWVELHTPNWS